MQERKGEGKKRQTVFPALSRPSSLDRGGSAPAEAGGGRDSLRDVWNVGMLERTYRTEYSSLLVA